MERKFCPWWLGYALASPVRRLVHNPRHILHPFVSGGMTVLEPGPGMGFFTLELARLVGPSGRVVAVDLQPRMLAGLRRRATRAGLASRIELRLAQDTGPGTADLTAAVDFLLAFAVVHELPDIPGFFVEARRVLKPGARALLAEPSGHVSADAFAATLAAAERAGFSAEPGPSIRISRTAILT